MAKLNLSRQSLGKIILITSKDGGAGKTYFLGYLKSMFPTNSCVYLTAENYYKYPYITRSSLPVLQDLKITHPQLTVCLIDEAQFFSNIEEIQKYKEFGLTCICVGRPVYGLCAEYEYLYLLADNVFLFSQPE
jgi:uridine kinase